MWTSIQHTYFRLFYIFLCVLTVCLRLPFGRRGCAIVWRSVNKKLFNVHMYPHILNKTTFGTNCMVSVTPHHFYSESPEKYIIPHLNWFLKSKQCRKSASRIWLQCVDNKNLSVYWSASLCAGFKVMEKKTNLFLVNRNKVPTWKVVGKKTKKKTTPTRSSLTVVVT